MRNNKLPEFKRKVMDGFPSPFMILSSVIFNYKNGHNQANTFKNEATSEF